MAASWGGGALGCGTTGGRGGADAGKDAGPGALFEAGTTCISAVSCASVADCVAPGTVAPCWQCLLGCCIPVPATTDPQKACDGGSACSVSFCDGAGACTPPKTAKDGAPCGKTCGGVFVFGRSTCQSGLCVGVPESQSACPDRCFGDYTDCPICDPPGCVASCDALPANRPDRCFP